MKRRVSHGETRKVPSEGRERAVRLVFEPQRSRAALGTVPRPSETPLRPRSARCPSSFGVH